MSRALRVCGFAILGLALLVGTGTTQDKDKKTDKKDEKKKDTLPPFFKGLSLTDEQVKKIGEVQADYKAKLAEPQKAIAELNKKVGELNKQQTADIFKVLTPSQKTKYDEEVANSKKKKDDKKTPAKT